MKLNAIDPAGADRDALVEFFSSQAFPFHVVAEAWSAGAVKERIAAGYFLNADNAAFWLDHDELGRVWYAQLDDLRDDTPMVDLRLSEQHRCQGLGVDVLHAIADYVFSTTQAPA